MFHPGPDPIQRQPYIGGQQVEGPGGRNRAAGGRRPPPVWAVAECAAYLGCAHYGIDTGAHTFGYVAGWARDRGRFRRNLGAARDTAHVVLDGLTAPATTATPGDALAA